MALKNNSLVEIQADGRVWENVGYVFVKYTHSQKNKAEVYVTMAQSKEKYESGEHYTPDLSFAPITLPQPCDNVLSEIETQLLQMDLFSGFSKD